MNANTHKALGGSLGMLAIGAGGLEVALAMAGCNTDGPSERPQASAGGGISPQTMADALYAVMSADRATYATDVVNRLVVQEKVIKASEHFQDDKALPLPAQMFRMAADRAMDGNVNFTYTLRSLWPINPKNAPRTDLEREGLTFMNEHPGQPFYTEEELAGRRYFLAIYPDRAVAKACVTCHNEHKDSPKTDFVIGDTMGGILIRIPI